MLHNLEVKMRNESNTWKKGNLYCIRTPYKVWKLSMFSVLVK